MLYEYERAVAAILQRFTSTDYENIPSCSPRAEKRFDSGAVGMGGTCKVQWQGKVPVVLVFGVSRDMMRTEVKRKRRTKPFGCRERIKKEEYFRVTLK